MSDLQLALFYLVFYLAIALFIAYVLLCGDAPRYDGTIIAKANRFCLSTCPRLFTTKILPRVLGNRVRASEFTSCCAVSCEKYFMPVAYHLILMGGLYIGQRHLASRLSELQHFDGRSACPASRFFCHQATGFAFPPRTSPSIIPVYYLLSLCSWASVLFTDPGTITTYNHASHISLYPFDNLLFQQNAPMCTTCLRRKPARSKHCRLCNRCVARFDHHCGWMANCIGLFNLRFFMLFLILHVFMLAHGGVVAMELVRAEVQRLVRGGYTYAKTGARVTRFTFTIAFAAEPTLCVMGVAFILAALLVFAFFIYHVWQVLGNITGNELAKWDVLGDVANEHKRREGTSLWDDLRLQAGQDPNRDRPLPAFDDKGFPLHIYDRGTWANIFEVLAPNAFYRRRNRVGTTTNTALVRSAQSRKRSASDTKSQWWMSIITSNRPLHVFLHFISCVCYVWYRSCEPLAWINIYGVVCGIPEWRKAFYIYSKSAVQPPTA